MMILSSYHPSVSSAPLPVKTPDQIYDGDPTLALRTTINSFNEHMISEETQGLVCDYFETRIVNEERLRSARQELLRDKDFDAV